MMLGASMGLLTPEVLAQLTGEIIPFAVPAEEFIEVEQRLQLREEGKIDFLGGKQELIRLVAENVSDRAASDTAPTGE